MSNCLSWSSTHDKLTLALADVGASWGMIWSIIVGFEHITYTPCVWAAVQIIGWSVYLQQFIHWIVVLHAMQHLSYTRPYCLIWLFAVIGHREPSRLEISLHAIQHLLYTVQTISSECIGWGWDWGLHNQQDRKKSV